MGYLTTYTLHTDADETTLVSILGAQVYDDSVPLSDLLEGEAYKWYQHEDDMLALSTRFPGTTFRLDGDGEESPDSWRKWFLGGTLIGKIKAELPPDPIDTALSEVTYKRLGEIAEQIKDLQEYKRLAKKLGKTQI